jgi:NAD+ diphosphatase
VREVKEELNLDAATTALIGVYSSEPMNQVIIAFHVTASGTIALNSELDDFKHVAPEQCRVWPGGTGLALPDWLRSRGIDPETMSLASVS